MAAAEIGERIGADQTFGVHGLAGVAIGETDAPSEDHQEGELGAVTFPFQWWPRLDVIHAVQDPRRATDSDLSSFARPARYGPDGAKVGGATVVALLMVFAVARHLAKDNRQSQDLQENTGSALLPYSGTRMVATLLLSGLHCRPLESLRGCRREKPSGFLPSDGINQISRCPASRG